jgi:protein-S-isoprenylcysteine O-methyltransferase Ste14
MIAGAPPPRSALPFAWSGALVFLLSLAWFLYSFMVRFGRTADGSAVVQPIIINLALFTGFAAHHSVFAREAVKSRLQRVIHPAVQRSLYTWIASLLFIGVCSAWRIVPGVAYRLTEPWSWLGYGVQLAGLLLSIQGSRKLDGLDLAGVRQVLHAFDGTEPPRHVALQTTGVFGVVRQPLYLGWALFVFGVPEMTMTRFVFAGVSTVYVAMAIPWEERGLMGEFGARYQDYRRQVRWRMIPGVY